MFSSFIGGILSKSNVLKTYVIFFYFFIFHLYNFAFCLFFTTTVTHNPYPQSIFEIGLVDFEFIVTISFTKVLVLFIVQLDSGIKIEDTRRVKIRKC